MTKETLWLILVIIIIFNYLLETILELLNVSYSQTTLPTEIKDIYNPKEYEKSTKYKKTNTKIDIIQSTFSLIIILIMFLFGGFAYIHHLVTQWTANEILVTLLFFGIIILGDQIIKIPFSYYQTFIIEEKFGFNKSTKKTFFLDIIKSWLLTIIIGGGLLAIITWLYFKFQQNFWWYVWIIITLFSLFMLMFYSKLIVPLFNKQTPLEDGELKNEILKLAKQAGFEIENIYVIDGSKRSTKANAYFTGLGKQKRIVLYDTLINTMEIPEILAVLSHEIGHYKHKHLLKSLIINSLYIGGLLYLFSLVVNSILMSKALLYSPFGFNISHTTQAYFNLNIFAFSILYSPVSTMLSIITNYFSRKYEYQADAFAKQLKLAQHLIEALKKLSRNNLSNLTPHPLYVKIYYSHPTLYQRIKHLQE